MKNGTLSFILVFSMISIGVLAQKKPNNHKIVFQFTNAVDTQHGFAICNVSKIKAS